MGKKESAKSTKLSKAQKEESDEETVPQPTKKPRDKERKKELKIEKTNAVECRDCEEEPITPTIVKKSAAIPEKEILAKLTKAQQKAKHIELQEAVECRDCEEEPTPREEEKKPKKADKKKAGKQPVASSQEEEVPKKKEKKAGKQPVASSQEEEAPKKKEKKAGKQPVTSSQEEEAPKKKEKKAGKHASAAPAETLKKKQKTGAGKAVETAQPVPNSEQTEVYIGGLPYTATEDDVKTLLADCGTIENVKFLRKHDGSFRGAGFVQFSTHEEAESALEFNGKEHEGRTLKVNFAANKPSGSRPEGGINTVCVRNMSYESTDDSVASFFGQCGTVVQVRVARGQDGRGKGFAHVEFEDVESADKAVALSGQKLDDRPLRVDYAHPKRVAEDKPKKA